MTATRIVGAAAAAALALTLAACGKGDSPSSSATPELGAIDKLWEASYGDFDQDDANRQQMEIEELVAECMAEEGFEYIPVDYSAIDGGEMIMPVDEDGEELQWGTLEFAKKYGYGQTTNPWQDSQPEPLPVDPEGGWVDPNQEYLESMSETEMAAYQEALWGVQPDFENEEDWENWNPTWEEQGCQGWAQHEVYGDQMWNSDPEDNKWADLQKEMDDMYMSMESDPRITEAVADWASCMADAGFPGLATIYDAEQGISEKVQAIYEENDPWAELGPDATEEDYAEAQKKMDQMLADITPEEIETATADFTCREEVDYQGVYNEVNLDLQQQFYDSHKAELEAYVEEMTAGQG